MLVLVRKNKYRSITPKKKNLVPSCLGPHSCAGLRETGNFEMTTPTVEGV